jgi:agmatinase
VSLPQLRAMSRLHKDLVAVHFDAHTDAITPPAPGVHHSGTQFHYAATEGLIEPARSFHIGLRGTVPQAGSFAHASSLGYPLVTLDELLRRGFAEVAAELRHAVGERPVYLCWDMDVLDPSCAPGVAAPSWGGLSAREAIGLLRQLRGLRIVHVDFNTVSPPHDHEGMTASLAAALMVEAMLLLL